MSEWDAPDRTSAAFEAREQGALQRLAPLVGLGRFLAELENGQPPAK